MKKKSGTNYFKGPKMAAKDDATILFAATILTAPTVHPWSVLRKDKFKMLYLYCVLFKWKQKETSVRKVSLLHLYTN
jgi:hypothetical protein